ncbi:MAG: exodeoxyribonuclease III [Gammaproteobacteria bacterium]
MRIVTLNCNGIRSADRKGFYGWLAQADADVVCLQETKAQVHQLADHILRPAGYHGYFFDAHRPGYSGTAVYSREKPRAVHAGLGFTLADTEGRYLQVDFKGLSVASLYVPSGSSGELAQQRKFEFMAHYEPLLAALRRKRREFILCGDWNIAHKPIDLKNWRGNQKNSGFLPEERAWLDKLFDEFGLVDAFRVVDDRADQYTWWSNRGQARAKNVGWRIDYQITTPGLRDAVRAASIYKDAWFSDHAPLIIDYDL